MKLTSELKQWLVGNCKVSPDASDETFWNIARGAAATGRLELEKFKEMLGLPEKWLPSRLGSNDNQNKGNNTTMDPNDTKTITNPTSDDLMQAAHEGSSGNAGTSAKGPTSQFLTTKEVGKHFRTGEPVLDHRNQPARLSSELEYVKAGVFLKYSARKQGIMVSLPDDELAILDEMFEKDTWVGTYNGVPDQRIDGMRVKTLMSDATSGGVEVNPEWFDENLVHTPLLSGQLFPQVTLRDVPRGSSVEGASIGNPTVQWGSGDGETASLFTTDSLIAEINTSIYDVSCFIEIGKNFLADAGVDVGRHLMETIGRRLAAELDKVIATGNGSSQPTGLTVASGMTSVSSDNGNTGPPTVDDYEALLFAVGKEYREDPGSRCAFVANDVSYQRVRGVPVSTSSDARRIFGMDHEAYTILNRPYLIQGDITNPVIFFGDLSRYVLYRRLGFQIEWIKGGKELARRNTIMLAVRGRFGGRVTDASAFAKISDAQTT